MEKIISQSGEQIYYHRKISGGRGIFPSFHLLIFDAFKHKSWQKTGVSFYF